MSEQEPSLDALNAMMPLEEGDADCLRAWRQLAVTSLKVQRRVEDELAPHGLCLSQFEAIAKIGIKPGMIQQELVTHLLVSKGNVGALLDRLQSMGLVERRPAAVDRRSNQLYLTAEGESLLKKLAVIRLDLARQTFGPLTAEQRRLLQGLLMIIEPPR
ncbi:MAG TPA: MarR family transcriptional regulator [Tepidisphaeraceae bacterium]|jgi:DNA-binding MarR family transcriptional regulator|nr:MarR family transcriptional regulator [Tepidisphaeraceae bacterium]